MRILPFLAIAFALAACQKQAPTQQANAQTADQPGWAGPKPAEQSAEGEEAIPAPKIDRSHAGSAAPTGARRSGA